VNSTSIRNDDAIPEEPPIRVMAIHALAYCERLFYLEEVEEIRQADDRVYEGRRLHEEQVPKTDDESRELRSFDVSADELGLFGKLDAARVRDGNWIVYEHKKGRCRRENDKQKTATAWPSDRLQIAAYAMLLEHQLGEPITEARIRYHQDNLTVTLAIDDQARESVVAAVARMRELRRSSVRPPVTDNEKLCRHCSLRVVCLPEEERLAESQVVQTETDAEANSGSPKTAKATLFPARRDKRTLHITSFPATVTRSDRTLVVDFDAILLYGPCQITSQALHLCHYENVSVQWVSSSGRPLGTLTPTGRVRQRIRQYQALTQPEICLDLARKTITAKVNFQLQYLLRGSRGTESARTEISRDLDLIRDALSKIGSCDSLDRLRGLEGVAAKSYFASFSILLNDRVPESLHLTGRTKHPPRDRVNCLLSFGYGMIFGLVQRSLLAVGLEPAFGFFHQPRSAAPPLVLDVMEIFRTLLWEMPLIGSLNRGQWDVTSDFEVRPGHVWLSDEGRKKAIGIFENRLSESYVHPYTHQSLEYGRMVELEIRLLEKEWTGCPGLFAQLKIR
jgi:CRISP-associated protein Cas1